MNIHRATSFGAEETSSSVSELQPSLVDKVTQDGIFHTLIFTRWRTPAVFSSSGRKLEPLSYSELKAVKITRVRAMRAAMSRLSEFDYLNKYPPVYDKFDVVIFWKDWISTGAEVYETWQSGQPCSCFVEVPEGNDEAVARTLARLDDALRGMSEVSETQKSCVRFLVLGGSDTRLSRAPIQLFLKKLRLTGYFDKIYYEAMDIRMEFVDPMPIGLTDFYVLSVPPGRIEKALRAINLREKQGILAAWGKVWPHLDQALPWRKELISWVGRTGWIQRKDVSIENWYDELVKYRFYIVPDGNGVCSPKWTEALILQTIPIVPPLEYYKMLQKQGYPMVVVNTWDDITQANLELWWEKLKDSLSTSSWMHTSDCWWDFLASNNNHIHETLRGCAPLQ